MNTKTKRDSEMMTLTSAVGRFFFSKEISLSHAKLIRDTVTAQKRHTIPSGNQYPIYDADDARTFISEFVGGPLQRVWFDVEFAK